MTHTVSTRNTTHFTVGTIAVACLLAGATAAQGRATVEMLPAGATGVAAINDFGVVAGGGASGRFTRQSGQALNVLPELPGVRFSSQPTGIDNAGQVVGNTFVQPRGELATLWTPGLAPRTLSGPVPDGTTNAAGISDSGWIAGTASTASGGTQLGRWDANGAFQALNVSSSVNSVRPLAINNSGWVVGEYGSTAPGESRSRAFVHNGSSFINLGLPAGSPAVSHDVSAWAISNNGMVAGRWCITNGCFQGAFVWTAAGGFIDIGRPAGTGVAEAFGINDAHQVVGTIGAIGRSPGNGAFLWREGVGFTDLAPNFAGTGIQPIRAMDINNRAQVVGSAVQTTAAGSVSGSYLLTLHPDWVGGNGAWDDRTGMRWNWGGTGAAAAQVAQVHDVWITPAAASTVTGSVDGRALSLRVGNTGGATTTLEMAGGSTSVTREARFEAGSVLKGAGRLAAGAGIQFLRGSRIELSLGQRLVFDGAVSLDGASFNVLAQGGFAPVWGASFDLIDWNGGVTGSFANVGLPALGGGLAWDTSDVTIGGSVSVVPEPSTWALWMAGMFSVIAARRRSAIHASGRR